MKEDENYITLSEPKPIKLTLPPAAATLLWEEGVISFEAYEKFMLDETGDYIPPTKDKI
jgi:hypothetical protein